MLGKYFFLRPTDNKQRVQTKQMLPSTRKENKTYKSTVLPQTDASGSTLTLRLLMSYIYIYIYMEHPFLMFLDHTQRRSTVGRTPLDE